MIGQTQEYAILEMIEAATRAARAAPITLGGTGGSGGGVGGPPGGFVGQLPQYRVTYDMSELATLDTLPSGVAGISGWSLVDNLNHIRYRIQELEAGSGILIVDEYDGNPSVSPTHRISFSGAIVTDLGGGRALVTISGFGEGTSGITVVDDNLSNTYLDVDTLHFSGAGVTVVDLGGGDVQVVIEATGSGGGGSPITVEEADGSPSVSDVDTIIFSGFTVVDLGDGDVLVSLDPVTNSGYENRQVMFAINGNLSVQSSPRRLYNRTGQTLLIEKVYASTDNGGNPTGDSILVDVNKGVEDADPTTIFTNQAHRPEIAAGAEIGYTTLIDVPSWANGEYLQLDIDQVGSTLPGSGLDVVVVARDTVPVIVFSGGGGGGSSTFLQLTDTPDTYLNQADKYVKVKATEDGLEFALASGIGGIALKEEGDDLGQITSLDIRGTGITASINGSNGTITLSAFILHKYNEDITFQLPSGNPATFSTELIYLSGTLRVYYNGIRQRKDYHYTEDGPNAAFAVNFITYSGDVMIVDYDYLESDQYVDEWHFGEWGMFEYPFDA